MGGKEGREEREIVRRGRERRERPGTFEQHQVSDLTTYNENNNSVKKLLINNDSSNNSYNN